MGISSARDFLGTTPSYTLIRDPILRPCHRLIACSIAGRSQVLEKVTMIDLFYLRGMDIGSVNIPYLLDRYLRLFAAGRKSGAHISEGQFVARLADHFGLLIAEILGGLTIIAPELLVIDMAELVRLVEGGQADPAPVQAPQQPPPPPSAPSRTMVQRLGRLEEDVQLMKASDRGLVRPAPPLLSRALSILTYQMVRSHPRFKHRTNEQCNKIPPLLKVSEKDERNGISNSYQKLKGFYKGVLNLGPDFIRVPSMEEWLTHGHISMHELE
ncbi:hypothetical protein Tco_0701204 [Tanacetum coccineum]